MSGSRGDVLQGSTDREDLAGHVVAEANHAKPGRMEDILRGIFVKIEE
jgi:hypothetical protein